MAENDEEDGWQTNFPDKAKKEIFWEALYLVLLLVICLVSLVILWWFPGWVGLEIDRTAVPGAEMEPGSTEEFQLFALAWLGGTLGGTAFAMKWLHYSVGKGPRTHKNRKGWTLDRRLWRFFVPILSGVISVAFYAALKSGLLNLEIGEGNPGAFAVAFGFIVGYFSDRAAAKLREVAYVVFGTTEEVAADTKKDTDENGEP